MSIRITLRQSATVLVIGSSAWVVLLLAGGFHSPLTFGTTLALLAVNACVCIGTLIRHKRTLVLLNLVQIALFTVAHYEIFRVWGAHHYQCDREPGPLDWLEFTGAHVLRAVDVLDILEEYGIDLQNVK